MASKEKITEWLQEAKAVGKITPTDYKDISKSFARGIQNELYGFWSKHLDETGEWWQGNRNVTVKNFEKKKQQYSKDAKQFPEPLVILQEWEPVWILLLEVEGLIKPARIPRSEPVEIDLTNTGTCPVCDNRQKLKDGMMVHHGYVVKGHERQGSCDGVGYPPWEVSPKGATAYLEGLLICRARHKGTPEGKMLNLEINWVTSKLRGWEPQPLP